MTDMGLVGRTIDHYRIEKLLGQGGMGSVFQAADLHLQRPVALKVMHAHLAARQEFQQRFLQEARAAAKLDHPSIVRVHTFGLEQGLLFMVMELITGGSLRGYLQHLYTQQKYIELPEAVELTRQVAEALDYAHKQGMIHRDIKPDNVILKLASDSGAGVSQFRAVLTDFGLAKLAEGGVQSATGQPMGTYPYMSPEQCLAEEVDGRTDIYALGIMLYELAVGRLPYQPKTITEAIRMHTREPLPAPTQFRPGLPPELVQTVLKSLQKNPADRFKTAGEMARALQSVQKAIAGGGATLPETPPTRIDSLATYLMSQPIGAQMPAYTPQPVMPGEAGKDRLIIVAEGQTTRAFTIKQNVIRIGRTGDNEVALNAEKVSRNHARVERGPDGRYRITDLGSTNGTWLGDARLLANTPEVWEPGQMVRIGPFWLKLEQTSGQPMTRQYSGSPVGAAGSLMLSNQPGVTVMESQTGQLAVAMAPSNVDVEAGGRADIQVEILNQGEVVDHFSVGVRGLPHEWVTTPPEPLQLLPGDRGTLPVSFHPPRAVTSAAGRHRFELRVSSRENQREVATMTGALQIAPFHGFTTDFQPKRLKGKGNAVLAISNNGNAPGNYVVNARDREEGLNFAIGQRQFSLEPGQTGHVPIQVAPKSRSLIGAPKLFPFEVAVQTLEGGQQTQVGEVVSPPLLPYWVLAALGFAIVVCLALVALGLGSGVIEPPGRNATNTAVAAASGTATVAQGLVNAQTADALKFAATQTAVAQATETQLALTAQAVGDDDADGLSNQQEAALGTNSKNADTDGDGLSDGVEVNSLGTDPKKLDTDGDTWSDGLEVNSKGTDPKKPDTDGDGSPDNIDPNPLLPPTLTATTSPTLTPTMPPSLTWTPSPSPTPTVPTETPTLTLTPSLTPTSDGGGGVINPGVIVRPGVIINPGIIVALFGDINADLAKSLSANRTVYFLKLDGPGTIWAQATWGGSQADLALIINGPGQEGYYARQDGGNGLSVAYDVTQADFDAGAIWRVTVASFGGGQTDNGVINLNYPGGAVQDQFAISPNWGSVVAVAKLAGPGTISGSATWTGAPANMALIVNGPGQVGYYARQDGPSELTVEYNVTGADFATGNQWRLSLVAFEPPSITEGTLNVWYP